MKINNLIEANNLNRKIQNLKTFREKLDFKNFGSVDIKNLVGNTVLYATTNSEEYAEFLKDRFEDMIDGLKRDIDKEIKKLEKEFANL